MSLASLSGLICPRRFPRVSGDEPRVERERRKFAEFSPRERG